jgi:hypothetical protein
LFVVVIVDVVFFMRFSRSAVVHLLRTIHSLRVPLFVYYAQSSGLYVSHILSATSRASSVTGGDADSSWYAVQTFSSSAFSSEFKVKDIQNSIKDIDVGTFIFVSVILFLSLSLMEIYEEKCGMNDFYFITHFYPYFFVLFLLSI